MTYGERGAFVLGMGEPSLASSTVVVFEGGDA